MSKITNDGLTRSGRGCSIAVPHTHMATVGVKGIRVVGMGCLPLPVRRGTEQLVNDPTHSRPLQTMCHRLSVKLHDTTRESPLRVSQASTGGSTSGHPVTDKHQRNTGSTYDNKNHSIEQKPRDATVNFDRYGECRQFSSFDTFSGKRSAWMPQPRLPPCPSPFPYPPLPFPFRSPFPFPSLLLEVDH